MSAIFHNHRQQQDQRDGSKPKRTTQNVTSSGSGVSQKKNSRLSRMGMKNCITENDQMQSKITKYISLSNSVSKERRQLSQIQYLKLDNDERVQQLEKRLRQKDNQILELKNQNQHDQARLQSAYEQSLEIRKKRQLVLAKSMLEVAEVRRKQKSMVNLDLGYFTDNFRKFIYGQAILNIKYKIQSLESQLQKRQSQKKNYNQSSQAFICKQSSIQFKTKQLLDFKKQMEIKEKQIIIYRARLMLADKQQKSQFFIANWPIIYEKYQTLELLGSGGFGSVYKCYDIEKNRLVAIKKINIDLKFNEYQKEQFYKHIKRQAEIQKQLNHPNIARLQQVLQINQSKHIIVFELEYCSGPELSTYMKKYGTIEERQAKLIIKQVLCALKYLSTLKQKVIHYDLKPSNIIFHNGIIKVLDFGLCKVINQTDDTKIELTSQGVGTQYYLPPQTFEEYDPQVSTKVDIWSVGVIFFEMLYGKRPFGQGLTQDQIIRNRTILKALKVQFPSDPPKRHKISESAKEFIIACLKYLPQERLSPEQAYQHAYFKK